MNEKTLERIDDCLSRLYSMIDEVEPGSEELDRVMKAIESMEQIRNEVVKTLNDNEGKDKQTKFNWINLGITVFATIGIPLIGIGVQRKTNIELMELEQTGVMNHKGWDNNLMKFFKR